MRTRIRMDSASFALCTRMVRDAVEPVAVGMAQVVDLEGENCREFLVIPTMLRRRPDPGAIPVYFHSGRDALRAMDQLRLFDRPQVERPSLLVAHRGRRKVRATWFPAEGGAYRVEHLTLVGSDIYRPQPTPPGQLLSRRWDREEGPWSRTIGGLGGDPSSLWRLQHADYAVVGCGRNGALVATQLASVGVCGRIRLIDDDHVEEHNVAAMGLDSGWVNATKVKAVEHLIRRVNLDASVETLEVSATSQEAVRAMASSDFILCAVDHGEGRLVAAAAGAAYLRPVLDVGSGIQIGPRGRWEAGMDVRLTPPGRCLVCFGGIENLTNRHRMAWWEQRAGSLRSINSVATGFAQTLLERFFSSDGPPGPVWINLLIESDGVVRSQTIRHPPVGGSCPVCSRLGSGDLMFRSTPNLAEDLEDLPF